MKHVRLLRHGGSFDNAGEPTIDHANIPLRSNGMEQARSFAHERS